jgi:periplasmic divalent cation tolerance protein
VAIRRGTPRPRGPAAGRRSTRAGGALVVLVTAPSAEEAARMARALVEERLAACGNVVPGLRSIYRWEGKVQEEAEALLLLKTTRRRFEALRARVRSLHPYEVPEVIALPVEAGHPAYLEWIAASTR